MKTGTRVFHGNHLGSWAPPPASRRALRSGCTVEASPWQDLFHTADYKTLPSQNSWELQKLKVCRKRLKPDGALEERRRRRKRRPAPAGTCPRSWRGCEWLLA